MMILWLYSVRSQETGAEHITKKYLVSNSYSRNAFYDTKETPKCVVHTYAISMTPSNLPKMP